MLKKIGDYIEKQELLTRDSPVVVGVSGGADSVALLVALHELGYPCVSAHCHFHLRGPESDRDAEYACRLSESLKIPFYRADFDTRAYAAEKHISIEMAARELRYHWFENLREELGAQAIAVAHHEQDNAETVLLNLVRGTGIKGLTGMQPRNGYVVRPLLQIRREDITGWLDAKAIAYVTDSTNLSDEYVRNFLRLRVIPLLKEVNPSVLDAIVRTAGNLGEAEAIYTSAVNELLQKILVGQNCILIDRLMNTPAPKTVLYECLKPYGFNRSVVGDVMNSLTGESGKRFYSATHQVIKDRGRLLIKPLSDQESSRDQYYIYEEDTELSVPFKLSLRKDVLHNKKDIVKDKNSATLDLNKLRFPLLLRRWQEGDWFIPYGMKGRKKVSDYFSDMKFSLYEKEKAWLLCSNNDIVWIVGERIDNRFSIRKTPDQALMLHFFE